MGWYQDYASAGGGLIPLPPRANYYLGWRRYQDYASARDALTPLPPRGQLLLRMEAVPGLRLR